MQTGTHPRLPLVVGTKIEVRHPHPSFRRTPDSCSAGTVPHPVPEPCWPLPFSSSMVPVATGMANCYENSRPTPNTVIPAKSLPRTPIRGRYPVPTPLDSVYAEATGSPHFHPLLWPAQGHSHCYENGAQPPHIVIPAKSRPRTRYGAGVQSQRRGSQSTFQHWAGPIFIAMTTREGAIHLFQRALSLSAPSAPSAVNSPFPGVDEIRHGGLHWNSVEEFVTLHTARRRLQGSHDSVQGV